MKWTEHYFPIAIRVIAFISYIGMLIAYVMYELSWEWIGISFVMAILIVGLKYELEVDKKAKEIRDSFQLFSLPIRRKVYPFKQLKEIRLDKEAQGYSANTRSRERQVKYNEYTASIITDTDEVTILNSTDYNYFAEKLKEFAQDLNLSITRSF